MIYLPTLIGMSKRFTIAIEPADLERLNAIADKAAEVEAKWLAQARKDLAGLRGVALSDARRAIRIELAELRNDGKLAGTRDLVMRPAVLAEVVARGLNRNWPPAPAGETDSPGVRWGMTPDRYGRDTEGETTLTARLPLNLSNSIGERVVRGCYWVSEPAVKALKQWHIRWGDGPVIALREATRANGGQVSDLAVICAMMRPRATGDALLERARLQAQVTTTGDVIRAAVRRVID